MFYETSNLPSHRIPQTRWLIREYNKMFDYFVSRIRKEMRRGGGGRMTINEQTVSVLHDPYSSFRLQSTEITQVFKDCAFVAAVVPT